MGCSCRLCRRCWIYLVLERKNLIMKEITCSGFMLQCCPESFVKTQCDECVLHFGCSGKAAQGCMVVGEECAGGRCICDMIFPQRKLNPLYFSPEIGCFLEYFGSFRNKMWSGGKRRDVKTNNTFCVALFQSKMPLVGLTSAGKKAYSPVRVAACSHRTLFKLHQGFFTLVYPSITWDRSCVPTRPT